MQVSYGDFVISRARVRRETWNLVTTFVTATLEAVLSGTLAESGLAVSQLHCILCFSVAYRALSLFSF